MRVLFFIISLLLLWAPDFNGTAAAQETGSAISNITVYLEGAQVTRTATPSLKTGKNEILFTGLSQHIRPATIRLSGSGEFQILGLSHQINYLEEQVPQVKLQELIARRDSLQKVIKQQQVTKTIIDRELNILLNNSNLKGDGNISSTELRQAMDYFHEKLTELETKKFETDNAINMLREQVNKLNNQISEYRNSSRSNPTSEIRAVVQSTGAGTAEMELSYLVHNAGWYPSYDIRVEDIGQPINFTYKANIQQSTGIDWNDVELTVSSAVPKYDGRLPSLSPWYVDFLDYRLSNTISTSREADLPTAGDQGITSVSGTVRDATTGQPVPTANVIIKGFARGTSTGTNGNFTLSNIPPGAKVLRITFVGYKTLDVPITSEHIDARLQPGEIGLEDLTVAGYGMETQRLSPSKAESRSVLPATRLQNVTSFSYHLEIPYSVESNGREVTADIRNHQIEAGFRYLAAPKLRKKAYLTARIADWDQYNLIPGPASLFFEDTYVGRTPLNPRVTGDTLAVSLGEDKGVVVERDKRREFEEKNFFRNRVRETFSWEITLRNTKDQPVDIEVNDQVPVSTNEDISVSLEERSGAEYNRDTGLLTWDLTLEPNETRNLIFTFELEYPRGKTIQYR